MNLEDKSNEPPQTIRNLSIDPKQPGANTYKDSNWTQIPFKFGFVEQIQFA